MLLKALNSWLWVVALLGLGKRFLNRASKHLGQANEAVLPIYILHQPAIIIIAYFVVQWDVSVAVRYVTTVAASLAMVLAVYLLLVRRVGILRLLFGFKLRSSPSKAIPSRMASVQGA